MGQTINNFKPAKILRVATSLLGLEVLVAWIIPIPNKGRPETWATSPRPLSLIALRRLYTHT